MPNQALVSQESLTAVPAVMHYSKLFMIQNQKSTALQVLTWLMLKTSLMMMTTNL